MLLVSLLVAANLFGAERELIWPKGKMPHAQDGQIAAMTNETSQQGFKPEKHRIAYLEWFDAPADSLRNGTCMILISGGAYKNCCDVKWIEKWNREFTSRGVQCVNFVYRTPRPEGLPIYQTAWEDGQRAVRMVRSEAEKRGFDPEKIGTISMSAGSHLALLLGTSSQTPAYEKVDALDDVPCHINFAIVNSPAYLTTDAGGGTAATRQGYGSDVQLDSIFRFDSGTCPMSLHHGGLDMYSPNGSTLFYRRLREAGVPSEVHLYPDEGHKPLGLERGIEFMTQLGFMGPVASEESLLDRYSRDIPDVDYCKEDVWPEGKTPSLQQEQNTPYIEWYIPKKLSTKAIQIIYSGGGYRSCKTTSCEVAPTRRYLNEKGMAVVVLMYRFPRPSKESGLAKHTTAWQDLQRAIRIVRCEAASRGLDPSRIGIMGGSAGGHLTLMGATSSLHQSYSPIDDIDKTPCNVQWGIGIYPAYSLTDGLDGHNATGGNADSAILSDEFSFDVNTCPMLFVHGDSDPYSAMASVKAWEKMRAMGIQSEVHTLATRKHVFQRTASRGTGSYTYLDRIWEFLERKGFNK